MSLLLNHYARSISILKIYRSRKLQLQLLKNKKTIFCRSPFFHRHHALSSYLYASWMILCSLTCTINNSKNFYHLSIARVPFIKTVQQLLLDAHHRWRNLFIQELHFNSLILHFNLKCTTWISSVVCISCILMHSSPPWSVHAVVKNMRRRYDGLKFPTSFYNYYFFFNKRFMVDVCENLCALCNFNVGTLNTWEMHGK
jgi:hypothetical protein